MQFWIFFDLNTAQYSSQATNCFPHNCTGNNDEKPQKKNNFAMTQTIALGKK